MCVTSPWPLGRTSLIWCHGLDKGWARDVEANGSTPGSGGAIFCLKASRARDLKDITVKDLSGPKGTWMSQEVSKRLLSGL